MKSLIKILITFVIFNSLSAHAGWGAVGTPVAAKAFPAWIKDFTTSGKFKDSESECRESVEQPGAYLCLFSSLDAMNFTLARASYVIDFKPSIFPAAVESTFYSEFRNQFKGHEFKVSELASYWGRVKALCDSMADQKPSSNNECLGIFESDFMNGFGVPLMTQQPDAVIIAFAASGSLNYTDIVGHGMIHAQFALAPKFVETVRAFWNKNVSDGDKVKIKTAFGASVPAIDVNDESATLVEFAAFLLDGNPEGSLLKNFIGRYQQSLRKALQAAGTPAIVIK